MKKTSILAAFMLLTSSLLAAGIQDKILSLHKQGETMTTTFIEVKVMPKMKKGELLKNRGRKFEICLLRIILLTVRKNLWLPGTEFWVKLWGL